MHRIAIKNLITNHNDNDFTEKEAYTVVRSTQIIARSYFSAIDDTSMDNRCSLSRSPSPTPSVNEPSLNTEAHTYLEACGDKLEFSSDLPHWINIPSHLHGISETTQPAQNRDQSYNNDTSLISDDDKRPYFCPIVNCTSRFSRKFNMIQHYRSHALRLGRGMTEIEQGILKLKKAKKGVHLRFHFH